MADTYVIRVVNYAGKVISDKLPHSKAKFSVYADQTALGINTAQIGRATITLFPPAEGGDPVYPSLALNQRVEIYNAGGVGQKNPLWSGIIDRLPSSRNSWVVECADSLQVAANSHRFIPFSTSETADVIIQKYGASFYAPVLAENFASGIPANYSTLLFGTGATVTAGTVEGVPGVVFKATNGDAWLGYTPSITISTDMIMLCDFVMTRVAGAVVGSAGPVINLSNGPMATATYSASFGLVMNSPTGASAMQLATLKGPGGLDAQFPIGYTDASGNITVRGQIAVLMKTPLGASTYVPYEILYNGQQLGAVLTGNPGFTTSNINSVNHVYWASGNTQMGTGESVFITNLVILIRQHLFLVGTLPAPVVVNNPPQHNFNNATCLDIIKAACAQEGWVLRKTPGVGWGNDTLDFGVAT